MRSIAVGSTVTITGTATDAGGGVVAGVEVSIDGGQTWHPATRPERTGATPGCRTHRARSTIKSRAVDDSGNIEHPSAGVTVSVSYQPTSTTGLVAAYGFNEGSGTTVADASGHGNTGTISGATWAPGLYGQALSFNGTNSWVTINDSSSLHLTNGMTLEAWVKPTASASNWTAVMIKERTGGLAYGMYAADGANQPPAAYLDSSNNDFDSKGISNLPLNTWSFLTGTYDGSNLRLYVNGTLVNTLTRERAHHDFDRSPAHRRRFRSGGNTSRGSSITSASTTAPLNQGRDPERHEHARGEHPGGDHSPDGFHHRPDEQRDRFRRHHRLGECIGQRAGRRCPVSAERDEPGPEGHHRAVLLLVGHEDDPQRHLHPLGRRQRYGWEYDAR